MPRSLHALEVRGVLPCQGDAGRAVRLVADHQVKSVVALLLCGRNNGQRLVGGEDDRQAFGAFAVPHVHGKLFGVSGDGDGDVDGADVFGGTGDLGV